MNILFCAAEQEELNCALVALRPYESKIADKVRVDFLLTGIGATSACYNLTKKILEEQNNGNPVTLVVNIGLAGSYNTDKFPVGSVALVESEHHGDLGFMTKDGFKSLFSAKALNANMFPYKNGELEMNTLPEFFQNIVKDIPKAKGITTQTVTGEDGVKEENRAKYDIESMEGAGVFYVCLCEHVNFIELRAVSNPVGQSDSSKWEIPKALEALEGVCRTFFKKIAGE